MMARLLPGWLGVLVRDAVQYCILVNFDIQNLNKNTEAYHVEGQLKRHVYVSTMLYLP